jgi:hypothetical protein
MTSYLFQIATSKTFDQKTSALKIIIFFARNDLRRAICSKKLESWRTGKRGALRRISQAISDRNKKAAPLKRCGLICASGAAGAINART